MRNSENLDDLPIPQIGTDIFDNLSIDEEPLDGPVLPEILQMDVETVATVVHMEDEPISGVIGEQENGAEANDNGAADGNDDNAAPAAAAAVAAISSSASDDGDIAAGPQSEPVVPQSEPVVPKKRGRPSLSASRTSTPKSATAPSLKRKASDAGKETPAKRSAGSRATASAASDAIKQASAKRPRAAPGTAKPVRLHLFFLHFFFHRFYLVFIVIAS